VDDNCGLIFDILTQILGKPRTHYSSKGQASWNCPVCDDDKHKGNFEVNYFKDVYQCWACADTQDTHGSIFKLIRLYGNKQQLRNYILLRPDIIKKSNLPEKVFTGLPHEFIKFSDSNPNSIYHKQAYTYITDDRGITDDIINKYNIGYATEGHYTHRIIIPSYNADHEVDYFSARTYIGAKRKYDNPEASKEKVVFNEYHIDWDKDVYIVEGALDHIVVENSIPMLGKKMYELLWNTLYDKSKANVIIAIDPDAMGSVKGMYKELNGGKLRGRVKALLYKSKFDLCELHKKLNKDDFIKLLNSYTDFKESKL
jgi:hypothetical protein